MIKKQNKKNQQLNDISFWEFLKVKLKNYKPFRKSKMLEMRQSLTLNEMVLYNQLKSQESFSSNFLGMIFLFPFYVAFYVGVFVIVMALAFGIDLKIPALLMISFGFLFWKVFIIIFALSFISLSIININYNRKLLEKIIAERKRK